MDEFVSALITKLQSISRTSTKGVPHLRTVDAIKVVHQVAEEHNAQTCRWAWGMDYAHVECKGDRIIFGGRRLFTYCPYCSKRIQVIHPSSKGRTNTPE